MTDASLPLDLVRLRPRAAIRYTSQGRAVLATRQLDACFDGELDCGFFVHQTRVVSRYGYRIDGHRPEPVALSNVAQHTWLGYYAVRSTGARNGEHGSPDAPTMSETLELRVARYVGGGLHEDLDLTNHSLRPKAFLFEVEIDADFADQDAVRTGGERPGTVERTWDSAGAPPTLRFDYRAEPAPRAAAAHGAVAIERSLALCVTRADSTPELTRDRLRFAIELPPRGTWHACLDFAVTIDGNPEPRVYRCRSFASTDHPFDARREGFLRDATAVEAPTTETLTPVVVAALDQAKRDLASLRLHDLDRGASAWTVAAGLPSYTALFGRDTLTAAWQAALLGPEMMAGTLQVLAEYQGSTVDEWRDEEPGRMLHEAHTGPYARLARTPRGRYYGSITTSGFYAVVVSELWHWTGDEALVRPFLRPAIDALRWLDRCSDRNGDGFYDYQTRSPQGVRNQAWKDSGDAIVDEDGRIVAPPIATCEEQGFVYIGKLLLSEVLWWLGEWDEARRLYREAGALKARFNDAFWMPDGGFVALGLDANGRQIRSVTSNPGHCLATGIADTALAEQISARLFASDLFSGWGVRTLSAEHPAYDPFSYHRGSVWPVEHGSFALGLMRYGLHDALERLCRAQLEAARLFDFHRLPEVFSGHPRDADHPFPAIYPDANSPQAWSASAVFCFVQALLGLYPYAPLRLLLVDPHLPAWLPEVTLRNLRVGAATASLRFQRQGERTDYEVLDVRGSLHVVRQPSPWSLTATWTERLRDVLASLLPGK